VQTPNHAVDSSDFEKRISELERTVGEIQNALFSHKVAIDSLLRAGNAVSDHLRELREELRGRAEETEGRLTDKT